MVIAYSMLSNMLSRANNLGKQNHGIFVKMGTIMIKS